MVLRKKLLTLTFESISFTENQLSERERSVFNKWIAEAQNEIEQAQTKQAKHFNIRRREVKINEGDKVLAKMHVLRCAAKNIVAKFAPKYEGSYKVIDTIGANIKILKDGKTHV